RRGPRCGFRRQPCVQQPRRRARGEGGPRRRRQRLHASARRRAAEPGRVWQPGTRPAGEGRRRRGGRRLRRGAPRRANRLAPAGYHLTNLVLHAANAVLVYLCIVALLRRGGAASTHLHAAALAGALFFALHPLRVESVAWATARRDVLSAFFFLLAVLTYLRMTQARGHGAAWLALSVLCFVLSLLSKAWGVALPVVLLLLDFHPLDRLARAPARVLVEKIPYVAIALAVTAVTLRTLGDFDVRTLAQHGVVERTAQAVYGLSFYLWKTVVPVSLSPLYPLPPRL